MFGHLFHIVLRVSFDTGIRATAREIAKPKPWLPRASTEAATHSQAMYQHRNMTRSRDWRLDLETQIYASENRDIGGCSLLPRLFGKGHTTRILVHGSPGFELAPKFKSKEVDWQISESESNSNSHPAATLTMDCQPDSPEQSRRRSCQAEQPGRSDRDVRPPPALAGPHRASTGPPPLLSGRAAAELSLRLGL